MSQVYSQLLLLNSAQVAAKPIDFKPGDTELFKIVVNPDRFHPTDWAVLKKALTKMEGFSVGHGIEEDAKLFRLIVKAEQSNPGFALPSGKDRFIKKLLEHFSECSTKMAQEDYLNIVSYLRNSSTLPTKEPYLSAFPVHNLLQKSSNQNQTLQDFNDFRVFLKETLNVDTSVDFDALTSIYRNKFNTKQSRTVSTNDLEALDLYRSVLDNFKDKKNSQITPGILAKLIETVDGHQLGINPDPETYAKPVAADHHKRAQNLKTALELVASYNKPVTNYLDLGVALSASFHETAEYFSSKSKLYNQMALDIPELRENSFAQTFGSGSILVVGSMSSDSSSLLSRVQRIDPNEDWQAIRGLFSLFPGARLDQFVDRDFPYRQTDPIPLNSIVDSGPFKKIVERVLSTNTTSTTDLIVGVIDASTVLITNKLEFLSQFPKLTLDGHQILTGLKFSSGDFLSANKLFIQEQVNNGEFKKLYDTFTENSGYQLIAVEALVKILKSKELTEFALSEQNTAVHKFVKGLAEKNNSNSQSAARFNENSIEPLREISQKLGLYQANQDFLTKLLATEFRGNHLTSDGLSFLAYLIRRPEDIQIVDSLNTELNKYFNFSWRPDGGIFDLSLALRNEKNLGAKEIHDQLKNPTFTAMLDDFKGSFSYNWNTKLVKLVDFYRDGKTIPKLISDLANNNFSIYVGSGGIGLAGAEFNNFIEFLEKYLKKENGVWKPSAEFRERLGLLHKSSRYNERVKAGGIWSLNQFDSLTTPVKE